MLRRVLLLGLMAVTTVGSTGCFVNQYSADPIRRNQQLLFQSEDLRQIEDEWERFWMLDQPSNMTLKRMNGMGDPAARRLKIGDERDKGIYFLHR